MSEDEPAAPESECAAGKGGRAMTVARIAAVTDAPPARTHKVRASRSIRTCLRLLCAAARRLEGPGACVLAGAAAVGRLSVKPT